MNNRKLAHKIFRLVADLYDDCESEGLFYEKKVCIESIIKTLNDGYNQSEHEGYAEYDYYRQNKDARNFPQEIEHELN